MRSALPWCYNALLVALVTERALFLGQIEKLLGSHALHGSESLCKLLRYLANHSLDHPGTSPKEYQIATEVFGRQQDFDPHVDSMVRVQAGRLRTKLAEYYASEGLEDPILVEIPKGTYALTFHHRSSVTPRTVTGAAYQAPTGSLGSSQPPRSWFSRKSASSVAASSRSTTPRTTTSFSWGRRRRI